MIDKTCSLSIDSCWLRMPHQQPSNTRSFDELNQMTLSIIEDVLALLEQDEAVLLGEKQR